MRRNMELVRIILVNISKGVNKRHLTDEADSEYIYHLTIMKQANLISFRESRYTGGMIIETPPQLTWEGNDFLDAISSDTVWNKVKEGAKSKGLELGSLSFSLLKDYAIQTARNQLGI